MCAPPRRSTVTTLSLIALHSVVLFRVPGLWVSVSVGTDLQSKRTLLVAFIAQGPYTNLITSITARGAEFIVVSYVYCYYC